MARKPLSPMGLRVLCRVSGTLEERKRRGAGEEGHKRGTISLTEEAQADRKCPRLQVAAPGIEPGT